MEYFKNFEGFNENKIVYDPQIRFTDWSTFKEKLDSALDKGFDTLEDLLFLMNMDLEFYNKIRENMIFNWIDSISKSLIHAISKADLTIPITGEPIFNDNKTQNRFIAIVGPGAESKGLLGGYNKTNGLGLYGYPSIIDIETNNRVMRIDSNKNYTIITDKLPIINDVLQYVWIYVFYNDYLRKKQNIKLPKYIYRGIRLQNLYNIDFLNKVIKNLPVVEGDFNHERRHVQIMDALIDHMVGENLNSIIEGKFVSFTSSKSVAKYFSNNEGLVIKVDTNKVRVVTSPLTDDILAKPNTHNGKKEEEYIVSIPDNYKIKKEDIEIVSEDYFVGTNDPMSVPYFSSKYKEAFYDMYIPEQDKTYKINAWFVWKTQTKGSISFSINGDWIPSRNDVKNQYGFDPMPSKENIKNISNFIIKKRRGF